MQSPLKLHPHLPSHEDVVAILELLIVKVIRVEGFCILVKGLELALIRVEIFYGTIVKGHLHYIQVRYNPSK